MPLIRSQSPRSDRRATRAAALLLSLLLVAAGVTTGQSASADGPGLADESFAASRVVDEGWTAFRDACLTGATVPAGGARPGRCRTSTGAPTPGVEPGYLQLTDTGSQGALLLDRPLPTAGGLQVEFAQYQYGGSGADGIGFVLADGSAPLLGIGPGGGALGYSTSDGQPGLPHAYLGLGLDAYGNFSTQEHLGGADCVRDLGGYSPDSIALRGPGDGASGYCLLATRRAADVQAGATLRGPTPAAGSTDLTAQRRLVRVVLSPTTAAQPLPRVTWSIDFGGTGEHFVEVGSVRMPVAPPETVKPGFTASVGGANDVHLIRDLTVRTVEPLSALTLRTGVDRSTGSGTDRTRFTTGDVVPLRLEVTNAGAAPLRHVAVDDPRVTGASCPATVIAPASTVVCTGTVTVTAEDARAGALLVGTRATATNDYGDASATASTGVPTYTAALSLRAAAAPSAVTAAGQHVTRTFVVTNTGSADVTDVAVEPLGGGPGPTCPTATLAAGASETCTDTVVTTQADQEAGAVAGTATAGGGVDGRTVRSAAASWSVPATPLPALQITAGAAGGPFDAPGQRSTVPLVVRNTGNLALTDLVVEPRGPGEPPTIGCPVTALAPGDSATCTAEWVLDQDDVEAGEVTTTVRGSARTLTGAAVRSEDLVAGAAVARTGAIALHGTAAPATWTTAGQRAVLSFTVVNAGSTRLTDVQVAVRGPSGEALAASCPSTTLEVGGSAVCTAVGTADQADVDRGGFPTTATASAGSAAGPVRSAAVTTSVQVAAAPGLSLSASAATRTGGGGTGTDFSFMVRNTGAVTLHHTTIALRRFSGTGPAPTIACPPEVDRLAPGASTTCTATYSLTRADIDAGGVGVTAAATAATTTGGTVDSQDATAAGTSPRSAALLLRVGVTPATADAAGQRVRYAFAVTNAGARTVTGLAVATGSGLPSTVRCPAGPLAPGSTATCSGVATVTQADADAGRVRTVAVATAVPAGGDPVSSGAEQVVLSVAARSAVTLRASAALGPRPAAGGVLRFTYVVVNTGTTTLRDVSVVAADPARSHRGQEVRCPGAADPLAPGRQLRCTAELRLTRADVRAGAAVRTAVAVARGPHGTVRSAAAGSTMRVGSSPGPRAATREGAVLTLSPVGAAPAAYRAAGQHLRYAFIVENTGTAAVSGLELQGRSTRGGRPTAVQCATTGLAPGQRTRCTAAHTVGQDDVDAERTAIGFVVSGAANGDPVASSPTTVTAASAGTRRIRLTAAGAGPAGRTRVGDVIAWTTTVRNSGTRTLRGIAVTDGAGHRLACPATRLAPGASMDCAVPRQVVEAQDLVAGEAVRTLTAQAGSASAAVTSGPVAAAVPLSADREAPDAVQDGPAGPVRTQPLLAGGLVVLLLAALIVAAVVARRRRRSPRRR